MSNNYAPTTVTPPIPLKDMTPLEYLLLREIFDGTHEDKSDPNAYFCARECVYDIAMPGINDLREALQASLNIPSILNDKVEKILNLEENAEEEDETVCVDVDLSDGPAAIFQDILHRSATLTEIVMETAWYADKMRAGEFGGSVTRITKDRIDYWSTTDALEQMRTGTFAIITAE